MHVRKLIWATALVLALLPAGLAAQSSAKAAKQQAKLEKKYAQLETKAARQHGHDLAQTLSDLAEYDYEFANASFNAGDLTAASQHLATMTAHADQACALLQMETQRGKKDGIKHVEKKIQQISFGLRGLAQSVPFSQQAKINTAVAHFTNLNYELLQWLFAPKS